MTINRTLSEAIIAGLLDNIIGIDRREERLHLIEQIRITPIGNAGFIAEMGNERVVAERGRPFRIGNREYYIGPQEPETDRPAREEARIMTEQSVNDQLRMVIEYTTREYGNPPMSIHNKQYFYDRNPVPTEEIRFLANEQMIRINIATGIEHEYHIGDIIALEVHQNHTGNNPYYSFYRVDNITESIVATLISLRDVRQARENNRTLDELIEEVEGVNPEERPVTYTNNNGPTLERAIRLLKEHYEEGGEYYDAAEWENIRCSTLIFIYNEEEDSYDMQESNWNAGELITFFNNSTTPLITRTITRRLSPGDYDEDQEASFLQNGLYVPNWRNTINVNMLPPNFTLVVDKENGQISWNKIALYINVAEGRGNIFCPEDIHQVVMKMESIHGEYNRPNRAVPPREARPEEAPTMATEARATSVNREWAGLDLILTEMEEKWETTRRDRNATNAEPFLDYLYEAYKTWHENYRNTLRNSGIIYFSFNETVGKYETKKVAKTATEKEIWKQEKTFAEIIASMTTEWESIKMPCDGDIPMYVIVPKGSYWEEFYMVPDGLKGHRDSNITHYHSSALKYQVTHGTIPIVSASTPEIIKNLQARRKAKLIAKIREKIKEKSNIMAGEDKAIETMKKRVPLKGGIIITKSVEVMNLDPSKPTIVPSGVRTRVYDVNNPERFAYGPKPGAIGHTGAIYFKDQVDKRWKAFLRNRRTQATELEGEQIQKVLDAIESTQTLTEDQRVRAINRIYSSLRAGTKTRLEEVEKEIKQIKEMLEFKTIDNEAWIKEGFMPVYNPVTMQLELTYTFQGYTLMKRFEVHVPFEFKLTFDMKNKKFLHANARCNEYGTFHPHVHSRRSNGWSPVCVGNFHKNFEEMVFLENSPHFLKGQLVLWSSRFNRESPASQLSDMNWKFAKDKETERMATIQEILNYFSTFRKISPASSGAVQVGAIAGFGEFEGGHSLENEENDD